MSTERLKSVFLTGFMGAGKSTVGQLVADRLNMPLVDLDAEIVKREQRTIATIFAEDGEAYFRNCETDLLFELKNEPSAVYATGGGVVVREVNREMMAHLGAIVYLSASWPVLQERLEISVDRPLVTSDKNWNEIKTLWNKRQPFYAEADIMVTVDGLNPQEVAQNILEELSRKGLING